MESSTLKISSRLTRVGVGAAVVLALVGVGAPAASATSAVPASLPPVANTVVALGDSVAAGYGPGTTASTPFAAPCVRTTFGYPTLVAASLGATDENRACSGATAKDGLVGPQVVKINSTTSVTVPSQLSQLASLPLRPRLAIVTVGANDVSWFTRMIECLQPTIDCSAYVVPGTGKTTTQVFTDDLNKATPYIAAALAGVKLRLPSKFVVVGYYDPFGATAGPVFGLTASEISWYRARIAQLNTRLQQLAAAVGATFVSTSSLDAAAGDIYLGNPATTFGFAHPSPQGQFKIAQLVQAA